MFAFIFFHYTCLPLLFLKASILKLTNTHTHTVTMGKTISTFTIFTFLLLTVSTASIALDPIVLQASDVVEKSSSESATVAGSDAIIPANKPESELDKTTANSRLPEKTQTLTVTTVNPTPRLIQRHFFDRSTRIPLRFVRRHPCRKFKKSFVIPTKVSYGNDMMVSDKTVSVDLEAIGDQMPSKWLEFKHKYGHRHRHHHFHHDDEKFEMKYEFDGEKMKSISDHHKEKKREEKGGFMRRIRKFLKHTFD